MEILKYNLQNAVVYCTILVCFKIRSGLYQMLRIVNAMEIFSALVQLNSCSDKYLPKNKISISHLLRWELVVKVETTDR